MKKFGDPDLYRSFVSGIVKNVRLTKTEIQIQLLKNDGNCTYSQNFGDLQNWEP